MINKNLVLKKAPEIAAILRSLGNEARLIILCHLSDGEKSVGELEGLTGLKQSHLSNNLKQLENMGFLSKRALGTMRLYSLSDDNLIQLLGHLKNLYCTGDRP